MPFTESPETTPALNLSGSYIVDTLKSDSPEPTIKLLSPFGWVKPITKLASKMSEFQKLTIIHSKDEISCQNRVCGLLSGSVSYHIDSTPKEEYKIVEKPTSEPQNGPVIFYDECGTVLVEFHVLPEIGERTVRWSRIDDHNIKCNIHDKRYRTCEEVQFSWIFTSANE